MNIRKVSLGMAWVAAAFTAHAADGLVAPAAETLWPQWQARITVLTATAPPLAGSWLDSGNAPRGLQGGA